MAKRGETKASATKRSKQQRAYNSTEKAKKDRVKRNAARRKAIREGRVSKGDGKDVDHRKPLRSGGTNAKGNTRVRSTSANRADNGSKRGMKRNGKRK